MFSYLSQHLKNIILSQFVPDDVIKTACPPWSSSFCLCFSPFLSTEAISSPHLLFLNYHASSQSGPWESDFRRRDGRPFRGGEKKLWMTERSDAPHLLMWCNCLLLSGVILSPSIQAECQGGYEEKCAVVRLWDETGSAAPFMLDGIEWWRNDMKTVHFEPLFIQERSQLSGQRWAAPLL